MIWPKRASTQSRPIRLAASLALTALLFLTTGFSSCAGTAGPLLVPVHFTPSEVLLRSSVAGGQEAVGLARVDNDDANDQYRVSVKYEKVPAVTWLLVEMVGRNMTLYAKPDGLATGIYVATVSVVGVSSGATASLRVEFTVQD